ncbi:MAG: class I SAM-dependent methyltransferase [Rubripirellula sp.]
MSSRGGYDRLAKFYRGLELAMFRGQLQAARVALLDQLPTVDRALVLGDGDGRFLAELSRSHSNCQIISVEQSSEMLKRQQQRIQAPNAVDRHTFVCQDASAYQPVQDSFDLMTTVFFLDCFTEEDLQRLLPQWLAGLRQGGVFYFVDFARPRRGWQRIRADLYLAVMHGFFRWTTGLGNRRLVDIDSILEAQPITEIAACRLNHELIVARLYRKTKSASDVSP